MKKIVLILTATAVCGVSCSKQIGDAHRQEHSGHAHSHGAGCGHEAIPHGDHTHYLVAGLLHHPDNDHCDHHGSVEIVNK